LQGLDIYTINYAHQISGDVATGDKGSHHLKYPLNKMNTDCMKRTIKALSGGPTEVILKSNGDETVQVVHQSVSDFLKAKGLGLLANLVNASKSSVLDSSQVISQCQATLYRSC
jgi:hypothetical protein